MKKITLSAIVTMAVSMVAAVVVMATPASAADAVDVTDSLFDFCVSAENIGNTEDIAIRNESRTGEKIVSTKDVDSADDVELIEVKRAESKTSGSEWTAVKITKAMKKLAKSYGVPSVKAAYTATNGNTKLVGRNGVILVIKADVVIKYADGIEGRAEVIARAK